MLERFWNQIDKTQNCWTWNGDRDKDGYGRIGTKQSRNKYLRTHRLSWETHYGPIPDGQQVLHHCDNPPCVRPDHLFLGTNLDNTEDAVNKGRNPSGESHGMAKVSVEQVKDIRRRYRKGGITQQRLADEYGLKQTTISQIVLYRVWKQVN